jgi:hypothetical protein
LYGGNPDPECPWECCELFDIYDVDTCELKRKPLRGEVPGERYGHGSCYLNNSLYIFGGFFKTQGYLKDLFEFDLKLNSWYEIYEVNDPRIWPMYRYFHSMVPINDKLYVLGGFVGMHSEWCLNDLWAFTPKTLSWNETSFDKEKL